MVTFPHGETNVTLACQNRCVSCNHFIPVQDPWYIDPADFERDLNMAAGVMHFRVFNLVGGEPTLHPQVVDLLKIVKASGIADRREITSNGQSWKRWPDALYQELDDLIVTPYKLNDDDRSGIIEKCAEFGVSLQWHPVIFTWAAFRQPQSPERATALYRHCWYAANRNVIDGGYFYRCCIGRFIPEILLGLPRTDDAIALEGLTEDALLAYMRRKDTPAACSVCAGNCGAQLPWKETSRENWLDESLA